MEGYAMESIGLIVALAFVLLVSGRFNKRKENGIAPVVIWECQEVPMAKSTSRIIFKSTGLGGFDQLQQQKREESRARFLAWSDNCRNCDRLYQNNLQARRYAVS
jgi:hypothetical protein